MYLFIFVCSLWHSFLLFISFFLFMRLLNQGHAVVHLVKALHYQPERLGFDSR
jgi:hypothetical protein